jgi:hypothetical protein
MAIIAYAYYQMRDFLTGPIIIVNKPQSGETVHTEIVTISGSTKRISEITLNDRKIFTDTDGLFSEKVALSLGYNEIEVSVKDRFDREETKLLKVVYR